MPQKALEEVDALKEALREVDVMMKALSERLNPDEIRAHHKIVRLIFRATESLDQAVTLLHQAELLITKGASP